MENKSRTDIISDLQTKKKRVTYSLPTMEACSDRGKLRQYQEDGVLLLPHEGNVDFKLIAVADGMGGLINGGQASNLALLELILWFEKLNPNYYQKESQLYLELEAKIKDIDAAISKKCGEGGTTLALAITCQNNTLFVNIGDSRIYVHKNHSLDQISKDHSLCYELYEHGIIEEIDDMRFHRRNNIINSRLGGLTQMLKIEKVILQNTDYEQALLFTDGVTDCLSDRQLEKITNEQDSKLARTIVDQALITDSTNDYLDISEYYPVVQGGKDNATAAVLKKVLK